MIATLIRATCRDRSRVKDRKPLLSDFSRKSLLAALHQHEDEAAGGPVKKRKIEKFVIHSRAKRWLQSEKEPWRIRREPSINWATKRAEFLAAKGLKLEELTGQQRLDLDAEFQKNIVEPLESTRNRRSIRKTLKRVSAEMHQRIREQADAARALNSDKLYSEALQPSREEEFYMDEWVKVSRQLNGDSEHGGRVIAEHAAKIQRDIELNTQKFPYLLTKERKVPSAEEVERKLRDGMNANLARAR